MTPEFPNSKREEVEARITALLLGELTAEEAASVREATSRDPELGALEQQLKLTIGLVREAVTVSPEGTEAHAPKLSAERRERLLGTFRGTGESRSKRVLAVDWRTWGALAAMVAVLAGVGGMLLKSRMGPSDRAEVALMTLNDSMWRSAPENRFDERATFTASVPPSSGRESEFVSSVTVEEKRPYMKAGDSLQKGKDNKVQDQPAASPKNAERYVYLPSGAESLDGAQVGDTAGRKSTRTGLTSGGVGGKFEPMQERFGLSAPANRPLAFGEFDSDVAANEQQVKGERDFFNQGLPGGVVDSKTAGASGPVAVAEPKQRMEDRLGLAAAPGQTVSPSSTGIPIASTPAPASPPQDVGMAVDGVQIESLAHATPVPPSTTPVPAPPVLNPSPGVTAPANPARPQHRARGETELDIVQNGGTVYSVQIPASDFSPQITAHYADGGVVAQPMQTNALLENYSSFRRNLGEGQTYNWDLGGGKMAAGGFGGAGNLGLGTQPNSWKDQRGYVQTGQNGRADLQRNFGGIVLPQITDSERGRQVASAEAVEEKELPADVSRAGKPVTAERSLGRMSGAGAGVPGELKAFGVDELTKKEVADPSASSTEDRSKRLKELNQQVAAAAKAYSSGPDEAKKKDAEDLKQVRRDSMERKLGEVRSSPPQKPTSSNPIPQPEVLASSNPFSTFSLNVSDVSFKLAGASLEKGMMPEVASVRSEEFINAFDYHDPEPSGSAPIAFNWERARYPFAHGRDLLRFSIKTAARGRAAGQPLNLVLLLDNSGSMERADRVRIRMECLRVLGSQLQPQDRVSVVAFARTARLWVDGLPGNQGSELPQRVGTLAPEGGTNLEEAMNLAYQTALRHYNPNGVNRVVLLTDGAANLGEVQPEALKKKVEEHRKRGVALDCFGIGWEGYNDDLLEVLSRNGDGRYGFVNSPEAAKTEFANQLAGALQVAASDVKVQVEFNPKRTTAYRQIGYAKHQLTKEQFRDNTVDAAEIGAAEAGNALYVVQVNAQGEGPIATVRARFKVPGTTDYREHEWVVPYGGEAKDLQASSAAMRLAGVASAFSEWLASSPYAGEVTTDQLLRLLSGVPETFGADPRPRKLEWMIRQAKSVSGN